MDDPNVAGVRFHGGHRAREEEMKRIVEHKWRASKRDATRGMTPLMNESFVIHGTQMTREIFSTRCTRVSSRRVHIMVSAKSWVWKKPVAIGVFHIVFESGFFPKNPSREIVKSNLRSLHVFRAHDATSRSRGDRVGPHSEVGARFAVR